MPDDQLNATDDPGTSEFQQLADDYLTQHYSYNGREDDVRRAIVAYYREHPQTPVAVAQADVLEALGGDPDTATFVDNFFSKWKVAFDDETVDGNGTGDGSSTAQLDGAPPLEPSPTAGEPVDLATGQFVHSVVDFTVSGAGIDLTFERTHRSGAYYLGPLGANWDHAYNLWLRVNSDGLSVSVTSGRLREIRYQQQQSYPYYYLAIADDDIVTGAPGTGFELLTPDGRVTSFMQAGDTDPSIYRVAGIADRFGNALTFSYDALARLGTVTVNNPARTVAFAYDDRSRITTITLVPVSCATAAGSALMPRIWAYTYDDYSDLVAVTAPATDEFASGRTTQYAYTSPSSFALRPHDLVSITDGNGATYTENEYGDAPGTAAFGKVVRQRVGSGVFLYEYAQVIAHPAWTFSDADRPAACVTVVQRDGHPVRYVLNALGNILAAQETILGAGEETVVWRYAYDADGRRTATLSPEGRVIQVYYGREDFYRRAVLPGDPSLPMWQDPNLSPAEHARFGNVIATVKRSQKLTLTGLLDDIAIYGGVFPDVLVTVADDIIVKCTYEPRFQQLATLSDARFTASPDPAAPESLDPNSPYSKHLTVTTFNGDKGATPAAIIHPDTTYPLPLPNGVAGVVGARKTFDRYDRNGRLLQWTEPEGNVFAFAYYPADPARPTIEGYLVSSTVGVGAVDLKTGFAVNEAGRVVAATDPSGNTTGFAIDAAGLLRSVTPPLPGYQVAYAYDGDAQVVSRSAAIIDPDGSVVPGSPEVATYAYNDERSVVLVTVGDGSAAPRRRQRNVYDTSNRLIRLVLPRGNSTCYEYDERSLTKRVTRGCCAPEAAVLSYGCDLDGAAVTVTDPRGHATSTKLDAFTRPVGVTDALGNLQRMDYDKLNNVVVHRWFGAPAHGFSPLLRRTEYLYDERGQRVRKRRAFFSSPIATADPWGAPDAAFDSAVRGGQVQFYDTLTYFDGNRRLFRAVDGNGHATTAEYDAADRPVTRTDAAGNGTSFTYNANGNLVRRDRFLVDAGGTTRAVISTAYEFDALNRLTATIDGAGNRTVNGLDSRGLLRSVTDPLGHLRKYGYDGFRDQVTATEVLLPPAAGGAVSELTTTRSHDTNGNVTGITDPNGNTVAFEYDLLDRPTRAINPDGTFRTMGYDRSTNLTVTVDEEGVRVTRVYDANDRPTAISVQAPSPIPVSTDQSAQFLYDGTGTLVGHANEFSSVAKSVDSLGRCYREILTFASPLAAPAGPLELTRRFDAVSNRAALGYPSGQEVSYRYAPDDRFVQLLSTAKAGSYPGDPGAAANRSIIEKQRWGELSVATAFGNGVTIASAYDAAARRIADACSLAAGEEFLLQQLWDAAGNRALDIESSAATVSGQSHDYDSTNRLIESAALAKPQPFVVGPLAPPPTPVPLAAFQCQKAIDAILASSGANAPPQPDFAYDAAGNRTDQQIAGGSLVYAMNTRNEYVAVGGLSLGYDRAGRLIDDTNYTFAYNFRGQLVLASQPNGKVALQVFHDALGRPVGLGDGAHSRILIQDEAVPIEIYHDGVLSALQLWADRDELSFIAAGGSDQYVMRDVLGSTRLISDPQGTATAIFRFDPFGLLLAGTPASPFLYSGKYLYGSIGWYEFRARQYIPSLGRFAQPDPMGFVDGANLYSFVGNNPLSATDPRGTDKKEVVGRAAAAETTKTDYSRYTANPEFLKRLPDFPLGEFGTPSERMMYFQKARVYDELDASRSVVESPTIADALSHKAKAFDAFCGVFGASIGYVAERPGALLGLATQKIDEWSPGLLDFLATYPEPLEPLARLSELGLRSIAADLSETRLLLRAGTEEEEITRFMSQGYTRPASEYLAKPYVGMGEHFLPRRWARNWGVPEFVIENRFNILKPEGISRGRFYELHYLVDEHANQFRLPQSVGGGMWRGSRLGLDKFGPANKVLYGTALELKLTAGGVFAGSATGVGVYEYLKSGNE
jgi:RHS repeat-associated protein